MAETRAAAERAFDDWIERYEDKYPKATACLARDREELLAFYDFPGVHWTHLRTTNVIESSFATIRHRSKHSTDVLAYIRTPDRFVTAMHDVAPLVDEPHRARCEGAEGASGGGFRRGRGALKNAANTGG